MFISSVNIIFFLSNCLSFAWEMFLKYFNRESSTTNDKIIRQHMSRLTGGGPKRKKGKQPSGGGGSGVESFVNIEHVYNNSVENPTRSFTLTTLLQEPLDLFMNSLTVNNDLVHANLRDDEISSYIATVRELAGRNFTRSSIYNNRQRILECLSAFRKLASVRYDGVFPSDCTPDVSSIQGIDIEYNGKNLLDVLIFSNSNISSFVQKSMSVSAGPGVNRYSILTFHIDVELEKTKTTTTTAKASVRSNKGLAGMVTEKLLTAYTTEGQVHVVFSSRHFGTVRTNKPSFLSETLSIRINLILFTVYLSMCFVEDSLLNLTKPVYPLERNFKCLVKITLPTHYQNCLHRHCGHAINLLQKSLFLTTCTINFKDFK